MPTSVQSNRRRFLAGLLVAGWSRRSVAAETRPFSPWCVAFSPDGHSVAAGSGEGRVQIWDSRTGVFRREISAHRDAVFGLAFSPDGKLLATCGRDAPVVRLWSVETGRPLRGVSAHPQWCWTARFHPAGDMLATCGDDAIVRLLDPHTGHVRTELRGHHGTVKRLAWTPNGELLVSVGDDGLVHVWDPRTAQHRHALPGHTGWLEGVACLPGQRALTIGGDRTLRLWDLARGKLLLTYPRQLPDLTCIATRADGELAVSGSADGSLWLWNAKTGEEQGHKKTEGGVLDVAFSPDGTRLASAHRGEAVRIWASGDFRELLRLDAGT